MVVLDTNIVIDHLRQEGKRSKLDEINEESSEGELAISVVTIQELYTGRSTREELREKSLLSIIASLKIFPYNYEIAKMAGQIVRDSKKVIDLADAAIAATAIINGAQFFTLN